jgi:hypothetical protein
LESMIFAFFATWREKGNFPSRLSGELPFSI